MFLTGVGLVEEKLPTPPSSDDDDEINYQPEPELNEEDMLKDLIIEEA